MGRFVLLIACVLCGFASLATAQVSSRERAELAQAQLLSWQDGDGGFLRADAHRGRAARRVAELMAERRAATALAAQALAASPQDAATRLGLQRARAWLEAHPGPRGVAPRSARPEPGRAPLRAVRAAIVEQLLHPGRPAEDALLAALDLAFAERAQREAAARVAPTLLGALGLEELEDCETLSRALPLLSPDHAARYRTRLELEARAALDAEGRVRSRSRRRGVSPLATARALLVLRRCEALDGRQTQQP